MSEQGREDLALKSIRGSLRVFGYDMSDVTDDELKKGLMEVHRVSVKCGLNPDEVMRLTLALARVYQGGSPQNSL